MIQRFQLYFPAELYLRLKQVSEREQISVAEFVRKAVCEVLDRRKTAADPLDRIVGKGRSKDADLSYRHDEYLYGLVKDAPARPKRRKR